MVKRFPTLTNSADRHLVAHSSLSSSLMITDYQTWSGHVLNYNKHMIKRNKDTTSYLMYSSKKNSYIFIEENAFENDVWKMASIFLGLNVLSLFP